MQTKVVGIDSNAMIDIFRIDIRFFGSQEAAKLETSQIEVFWQNKVVLMDMHFESMASQFSSNLGTPTQNDRVVPFELNKYVRFGWDFKM